MRKYLLLWFGVSILCALLAGCSDIAGLTEADLCGKYQNTLDYGIETIELKSDKTFVQTYAPYGGKTIVQNGKWEALNQGTSHLKLYLRNGLILDEFYAPPSPKAIRKELLVLWPYGIRGQIYLTNLPYHDKVYEMIK